MLDDAFGSGRVRVLSFSPSTLFPLLASTIVEADQVFRKTILEGNISDFITHNHSIIFYCIIRRCRYL
jgi:hypothetical protein